MHSAYHGYICPDIHKLNRVCL